MTHRDFDQERLDRIAQLGLPTFTLCGENFTLRDDVRPDVLALWDEFNQKPDPDNPVSQRHRVESMDLVWHELLVVEDGERYDQVRQRPDGPGLMHLVKAAEWAIEQITSRPFEVSSGSGTSPGTESTPAESTEQPLRVVVGESGVSASGMGAT